MAFLTQLYIEKIILIPIKNPPEVTYNTVTVQSNNTQVNTIVSIYQSLTTNKFTVSFNYVNRPNSKSEY